VQVARHVIVVPELFEELTAGIREG